MCLVIEARDATKHPVVHRTALQQRITQPRVSAVLRVRALPERLAGAVASESEEATSGVV